MSRHAEIKTVLVRARQLLSDRSRWIKGRAISRKSGGGFSYCLIGAVYREVGYYPEDKPEYVGGFDAELARSATRALEAVIPKGSSRSVPFYNDSLGRTHDDVLALLDAAIAAEARLVATEVQS